MSENEKGGNKCQKCGTPLYVGCECGANNDIGISKETSSILFGNRQPSEDEKQALGVSLRDAYVKNSTEFVKNETGVYLTEVGYAKLKKDFDSMIAENHELAKLPMSFKVDDEVLAPDDSNISNEFIKAKVVEANGGHYILEVESSPGVYGHMICNEKELKEWNSN